MRDSAQFATRSGGGGTSAGDADTDDEEEDEDEEDGQKQQQEHQEPEEQEDGEAAAGGWRVAFSFALQGEWSETAMAHAAGAATDLSEGWLSAPVAHME